MREFFRRHLFGLALLGLALAVLMPLGHAQIQSAGGSGGGGGATQLATTVTNLSPTALPHWRHAIANVLAGTGRGRLCFVGNSTLTGFGSQGGNGFTNSMPFGTVPSFARMLNAKMVNSTNSSPVSFNSVVNDQNINIVGSYPVYDTRVTFGANWNQSGAAGVGVAGQFLHYTTGAVNNLTFTPNGFKIGTGQGVFDTITVSYIRISSFGTTTINVDGGASLGTMNANVGGGFSLQTDTFSVTRGTHTINVVGGNAGDFYIQAIAVWDSTVPAIDVFQLGWGGGGVANLLTSGNPAFDGVNGFNALNCDLIVMQNTIIDSDNALSLATYSADITTWATAMRSNNSDVILAVDPPSNTTNATNGTLDTYIASMAGVAASYSPALPMVNIKARWTSYAVTNPILPYYDALHPGQLGYQDIALAYCQVLCP